VHPIARRLPFRTAPNDVSFASQLCALVPVIAAALLGVFSPWWMWAVAVPVGYLGYIVLDSVDGTHARRTKTSSPLGELVDHWCDAWNAVLLPSAWGLALDASPTLACTLGAITGLAYVQAMDEHRRSGTLRMDAMGGGEAMTAMMLTMVALGIFGRDAMTHAPLFGGFRVVDLLHAVCAIGSGGAVVAGLVRRGPRALARGTWSFVLGAALIITWVTLGLHPIIGAFAMAALSAITAGRSVLARTTGISPRVDLTSLIAIGAGLALSRIPALAPFENPLGIAVALVVTWRACADFYWGTRALRQWVRPTETLGIFVPALLR
jgi:phosphatidylglycerophosphate synthase